MRRPLSVADFDRPCVRTLDASGGVRDHELWFRHELFEGTTRRIALGDATTGLVMYHGRHRVFRDVCWVQEQSEPVLALHFNLGAGNSLGIEARHHALVSLPKAGSPVHLDAERRYEAFEINLSRPYLTLLAERYPELGERLRGYMEGAEPLETQARPIRAEHWDQLRRIEQSAQYGSLRGPFLDAMVLELLIEQLAQAPKQSRPPALTRRAAARMIEARDRLLSQLVDPPSLRELARQLGTNEFTLKRDFKRQHGLTVFAALRQARMERARRLLLETELTLDEVATHVGYAQAAHFSTAFKRAFGVAPGRFRRQQR